MTVPLNRLRFVLGVFIVLLPALAAGQATTATVSGRVLDAANGSPMPLVSIIVETPAGQPLSGALTAENGRFQIQGLPPGTYKVTMTFPGFQPANTNVLVSTLNQAYDLGDIRLPRLQNFEDTIAVTAGAIRVAGTDTQVFRLDAGPAQSTGSLLDALKGLPGVTIDQEGRVLLRGSDRVAILIDGRPSSLTGFGSSQRGLDSVTAGNVDAIEIINNPSARFDAAGMAGIINIIYKQQEQLGFSGEIGAGLAVGQFTKQRADLPTELGSFSSNGKLLPNVSLNYRTPTVRTFFQGELLLQNDLPNNEFTTRTYDDGRVLESQVPENRKQYHYTVRFGADWKVSSARTLTVSGIHDFEEHIDRAQVPFILQPSGVRERFWFWRERETTGFTNVNADFRHQFSTPGHSLGINLQYTRGKEDEAYFLNEVSPVRVGTDDTHLVAIENTLPLSVDYTRPMRAGRLELGAKLQRRWIPVTYTVGRGVQSVIYDGLGDFSDWDEDIYAGYANFIYLQPAYTVEAGLRVEQTNVSYTIPSENIYYPGSDSYDDFEAFPNLKFTYRLSAANRLVGAYNRRVDRPGEPELRIFPKYDDPELLKVGNPFLRPQFTNVVEGSFVRSWAGGSGNVALYHRDIDDAFSRIFAIDSSNPNYDIVNRLYENAGNTTQTGVQLLADHAVSRTWRASGGVNVYRNTVEAFETILLFPTPRPFALAATEEAAWEASVNNQFRLPRAVELSANVIYYAARNVPQGRERDRSSLDLSATWPLRGDRAELLFTFTDVFNDFAVEREVTGQGFTALYQNFLETQVATVTLKVRF